MPNTPNLEKIGSAEARRVALGAQGFGRAPGAAPNRKRLEQVIGRLGLLQMDSVNVLARAHYLPVYSRLGAYDTAILDAAAWGGKRRTLFEYWGHEASLLPLALHPLLRWRMDRAARGEGMWSGIARLAREKPGFIENVYREVETRGPLAAGDIDRANHKGSAWWGWTETKVALEWLFWTGRITAATRRGFERIYDLTERVIPDDVRALPTPAESDAHRQLIAIAAKALGIATEPDLRDYFRLDAADSKARVAELVEAGTLIPCTVKGWSGAAYLHAEAAHPRRIAARALVSPFDPLIWERPRTERLFGFHYRIEIYTPAHKRVHGYYVLPFLLGDRLVGRVDLKAERKERTLRVAAAHIEDGADPAMVAPELAAELARMAGWLGLESVTVDERGGLAKALKALHA